MLEFYFHEKYFSWLILIISPMKIFPNMAFPFIARCWFGYTNHKFYYMIFLLFYFVILFFFFSRKKVDFQSGNVYILYNISIHLFPRWLISSLTSFWVDYYHGNKILKPWNHYRIVPKRPLGNWDKFRKKKRWMTLG